jgi:hypothetical protein
MQPTCPDHADTGTGRRHCHRCAARALWFSVPSDAREQIDALVRQRAASRAVRTLRAAVATAPVPALPAAFEAVLERSRWLEERGEVVPAPGVPSVDEMAAAAEAAGAPVVAVEVCWDGDPFGWIEDLVAVVERPSEHHPRYDEVALWSYRDGAAAGHGKRVAERIGVPFHFEQPDPPDLDLPRWWDRSR